MHWKYFFVILFLLFCGLREANAQDIHWSQYNDNPLFQNPANAGNFKGDIRFTGNFRDQWRSVSVPFSTFSGAIDKQYKSLGFGLLLFHDQAGDGKLSTLEIQGNLAYGISLTKDKKHSLRVGANIGMNHRQVNWNNFYFDNQYNGYIFNPGLPSNEVFQSDRKTNFSIGTGLAYEWIQKDRQKTNIGIGIYNLNQPNQGFYNQVIKRPVRMTLYVKQSFKIKENMDLIPSFQFQSQGVYKELNVGTSVKYYLKTKDFSYQALYAGLWMRNKDASFLTIGYDYQDFFVGLSYDMNFSKLVPASHVRGGFEIAVRYIINRFKPKRIEHRVCPDFI